MREIIIDKLFKGHGFVIGIASGKWLPECRDTGTPMQITDLKIKAKCFKDKELAHEFEMSDELEELVEQYAVDQLCGHE